jgi:peptidoglycan/xylan/chitin deacetylase (PgdA/CDA1 family)
LSLLRTHGRFGYSSIRDRPSLVWPGGARLACYVAVNVEHFAWGEGAGAELVPKHGEPDVLNYAWREYGNRVGVWRLLDLLEAERLPAAALINTALYDHAPAIVEAFRARGDEIVAHGRTNAERQGDMDEATERAMIAATTQTIARAEGAPPGGWLGPWISESAATPDLLAEAGYRYVLDWCMDDQPVWLATRGGGRILSVPYPQEVNDIPAIVARRMSAPDFCDMIVDTFEEMLAQSASGSLVMGIAIHPYIMGQPHRLRPLRRALRAIAERPGVWWTTPGEIAAHFAAVDRPPA